MTAPFEWMAGWDHRPVTERPIRVIGIDLGTTNSTVTEIVWEPGSGDRPLAEVIEVEQETLAGGYVGDVVPSVVGRYDGQVLVGEGAARLRGAAEPHLVRNKELFWEAKNEIGTRRTYVSAPEGFTSPADIAGHILSFLHEAAQDAAPQPIDRVVITVPASFQWEQRLDTLKAAEAAGLEVQPGDLLDEPVAAFLDYLAAEGTQAALGARRQSTVMVLDFGGGTCDVALLKVTRGDAGGLDVARVGVSRFHRIGGSDIDSVIAHDVLLPALASQNDLDLKAVKYSQKSKLILPALQGVASALKVKLSEEIRRRQRLGVFDAEDRTLAVSLPAPVTVPIRRRGSEVETVQLANPSLTLPQLQRALQPFFSRGVLLPKDGEYTHSQSVFAPVSDVLARCDLLPEDVDACLLVGGSSLFPPLVEAVEAYLPAAGILTYKEPRDALRCVGRGAAYHAMLLAAFGTSPLAPTTGDAISVRTRQGLEILAPRNAALPYPADGGWATLQTLQMPAGDGRTATPLTLELVSGSDEVQARTLVLHPVSVSAPVRRGDPITLRTRVDANQRLELEAIVSTSAGEQRFEVGLDNPFSVTINPNRTREQIMALEERINAGGMGREEVARTFSMLARLHTELGERERAREYYEQVLALGALTVPEQANLYNTLGILCGQLHDSQSEREYYQRAAELSGNRAPLFNLALSLQEGRQTEEALGVIDDAITHRSSPAYHALRARILSDLGRREEARVDARAALDRLGDLERESDFELGWAHIAARQLSDRSVLSALDDERARRARAQRRTDRADERRGRDSNALPERMGAEVG